MSVKQVTVTGLPASIMLGSGDPFFVIKLKTERHCSNAKQIKKSMEVPRASNI